MECREKLICLRKKRGLTQQELAEAVNVSRQAISKWELGAAQPSTENFRSLSMFYGVPVDVLLNGALNLPEAGRALPEVPVQQDGAGRVEDRFQGDEIKKEISALKKWMIALVAVVAVLALAATVYIVGVLREGSDAIPINELEQEYVELPFDGEFDYGWYEGGERDEKNRVHCLGVYVFCQLFCSRCKRGFCGWC